VPPYGPVACPSGGTSKPGATSQSDCVPALLSDRGAPLAAPSAPLRVGLEGAPLTVWPTASVLVVGTPNVSAWVSFQANCAPGDTLWSADASASPAAGVGCSQTLTFAAAPRGGAAWEALLATVRLNTTAANPIPLSAPRVVRFAVGDRATLVDVPAAVAPVNDAPTFWGAGGRAGATEVSFLEGAPAEVMLVVASPGGCGPLGAAVGGAPALCFEDVDPRVGRGLAGSSWDNRTSTFLGALSGTTADGPARDNAGGAASIVSRYTLLSTAGACGAGAALAPVGEPAWDCTAIGGAAARATTPINGTLGAPHAPFGLPPAPGAAPRHDSPCLAQRLRLTFGGGGVLPPLAEDGCGSWGGASAGRCALDFEADYCGGGVQSAFSLSVTLSDFFALSGSTVAASAVDLTLHVLDAAEPPALAWSDNATLAALSSACPACAPPGGSPPLEALVDDITGAQPVGGFHALLLCSQANTSAGVRFQALPVEGGAGVLALGAAGAAVDANAMFVAAPLMGAGVRLSAAAAPSCVAALRALGANSSVASTSPATPPSGAPVVWVRAFAVRSASGAPRALTGVPARAFTLLAEPTVDATGLYAPLPLPVRLVRANQPVAWAPDTAAAAVNFTEHAPRGTLAASTLRVIDADTEQDVAFSVVNSTLVGCATRDGLFFAFAGAFSVPAGLFELLPLPATALVVNAATGAARGVNSTRALRVAVGVDALDIDEPSAACGVPAAALASCSFALALRATDSGDPSPSHTLLPRQNSTSAEVAVTVLVSRLGGPYAAPTFSSVEGLPPAGLSVGGGDVVDFVGAGLGLSAGPTSNITLLLKDAAGGAAFSSRNCTVVVRNARVRCVTPAGSGDRVALSLQWASGSRGVSAVPPLALGFAEPSVEASAGNGPVLGTAGGSFLVVLTNGPAPVLLLRRPRGVWGVPLAANASCAAATAAAGGTLRSGPAWRGAVALNCSAPPGVGAAAALDAPGAVTSPARLSLPPPRITEVSQECASDVGCAPLGTFIVRGVNLGNAAPHAAANAAYADAAAATRRSRFLQGFDFVQYAVLPVMDTAGCVNLTARGALLNASCALHTAVNCSYVTPHVAISCELDTSGWGTGFSVRVVVGGQASPWSAPALAYPAPTVDSVVVVWSAGAAAGAPQAGAPLPNGGSLLRIRGAGLAPLSQLVLFVGGVPVRPLSVDFGATARARAANPPRVQPDGRAAAPAAARAAPVEVLFVCAPPGLGTVSVVAWVGNRGSAPLPLVYAQEKFRTPTAFYDPDIDTVKLTGARFTAGVLALPACGLCFADVPPGGVADADTFSARACNASLAPWPPASWPSLTPSVLQPTAGLRCPHLTDVMEAPLSVGDCALPDSMWYPSAGPCGAGAAPLGAPGALATAAAAAGTRRCGSLAPPIFDFRAEIKTPTDVVKGVSIEHASLAPAGDSLRLKTDEDAGTLTLSLRARNGFFGGSVIEQVSASFSKAALLGRLPKLEPASLKPPQPPLSEGVAWPPGGGLEVQISITNGGDSGALLVSPQGMPLLPRQTVRVPDGRLLCTLPRASAALSTGWPAGPLVCPITRATRDVLITGITALRLLPRADRAFFTAINNTAPDLDEGFFFWSSVDSPEAVAALEFLRAENPSVLERIVYEPCARPHWIQRNVTPCRILSWDKKSDDGLTLVRFSTPPWQGSAFISAVVQGLLTLTEIPVVYAAPSITDVSGAVSDAPSQGGAVVTVSGKNFGNFSSLGALWRSVGADVMGYGLNVTPALGANAVLLQYAGAPVKALRPCTVLSWSDTAIRCALPVGVPTSVSEVLVQHNLSASAVATGDAAAQLGWAVLRSADVGAQVRYHAATLSGYAGAADPTDPSLLPTSGGYTVMVAGANLCQFGDAAARARACDAKGAPGACAAFDFGDCASGGFWSAKLLLEADVVGERDVGQIGEYLRVWSLGADSPLLNFSHAGVNFTMPAFEGTLLARVVYSSDAESAAAVSSDQRLVAASPRVTMMAAFNAADTETDANPLAELGALLPKTPEASSRCVAGAWAVRRWVPASFSARVGNRTEPAFRAHASAAGARTSLRLAGAQFGTGTWKPRVIVLPRADAEQDLGGAPLTTLDEAVFNKSGRAVECSPPLGRLSVFQRARGGELPVLECELAGDLPEGPVEVLLALAYTYTRLSAQGIMPLATCACGFFAAPEYAGGRCLPCPLGARCRGGGDPPRAVAGAWRTLPDQWAERGINVSIAQAAPPPAWAPAFPLFVICPLEGRCLPDGGCTNGSAPNFAPGVGPWMCLPCEKGWVADADGVCVLCSPKLLSDTRAALGGSAALIALMLLFAYFCLLKPMRDKAAKKRAALIEAGKTAEEVDAMEPHTRPIFAYIKILLTYAQTLGAIASYTRSFLTTAQRTSDVSNLPSGVLLPAVLDKLTVTLDMGLSATGMRCLFPLTYEEVKVLFMMLPALAALTGLLGGFLGKAALNAALWAWAQLRPPAAAAAVTDVPLAPPHRRAATCDALARKYMKQATKQAPEWLLSGAYVAALLTFLVLPVVISQLAATQACASVTSGGYLREAPEISCSDKGFKERIQGPAFALAWFYMLVPLVGGGLLIKGYAWTNKYLTFLTEGYNVRLAIPRAWECFVLLRKLLLVGLSTSLLLLTDARAQLTYTMFLLSAFVGMQVHFKPLESPLLNLVETLALVSELAFTFAVMIRQQGSSGERTFSADGSGVASAAALQLSAATVTLRKVSDTELALFDVIAAALAGLFIFAWLFVLLNDKMCGGWPMQRGFVAARRVRAHLASAAGYVARALGLPARASRLAVKHKSLAFRKGWLQIRDPGDKPMWAPPRDVKGLAYLSDKERNELTSLQALLPLESVTTGGWYRLDPHRLGAPATGGAPEWANDAAGDLASEAYPPLEPPKPPRRGPWARLLPAPGEEDEPPMWEDAGTHEVVSELPEWEVTKLGWSRIRNLENEVFWVHWPTMDADWGEPPEELLSVQSGGRVLAWYAVWDARAARVLAWLQLDVHRLGNEPVRVELAAPLPLAARVGGSGERGDPPHHRYDASAGEPWEELLGARCAAEGWPQGLAVGPRRRVVGQRKGMQWYYTEDAQGAGFFYVPGAAVGDFSQRTAEPPLLVRAPQPALVDGGGVAAADSSAPPSSPLLPAPFNVWFPVRHAGEVRCWANVATGVTSAALPPRAVAEVGVAAGSGAGGEQHSLLHWLPAPSRWALVPGAGGAWRELPTPRQKWGELCGGGVGPAMLVPFNEPLSGPLVPSDRLPFGAASEGGWRRLAGEDGAALWAHPALACVLSGRPPTEAEDAEGAAARRAAEEARVWFKQSVESATAAHAAASHELAAARARGAPVALLSSELHSAAAGRYASAAAAGPESEASAGPESEGTAAAKREAAAAVAAPLGLRPLARSPASAPPRAPQVHPSPVTSFIARLGASRQGE
jgi:hypothetical protein